ncbi:MAG: ABC-2 transporter permease [Eubacterium sp.]|nr:ABC-2 transporter permease [Eubacterium sp.]
MRGLIYKDLYLVKSKVIAGSLSILFIILLMYVIYANVAKNVLFPTEMAAVITDLTIVMYIGALSYGYIIKTDTKKQWGFYGMALPGSAKLIVGAKYMTVFIMYLISYIICVLNDLMIGLFFGKAVDMSLLVLMFMLFQMFLNAIEMPFAFRFGTDKASGIRILITTVVVLVISIYLLFGNIEWLMAEDGLVKTIIRLFSDNMDSRAISGELQRFINRLTLINYIEMAVFTHLMVLVYYISYRISCKVFRKGVLRDDN